MNFHVPATAVRSETELAKSPQGGKHPRDKIVSLDELGLIAEQSRAEGWKIVQAHGTFDLLHLGHFRHLQAAADVGDLLVVTLTADRYVNKGPGRPVFSEAARAEMLASLEYVDWVAIHYATDAVSAINVVRPHVYAKGQDYQDPEGDISGKIVFERQAVEGHGGRIHFTNEVTFSSTELLNRHFNIYEPHVREHLNALRSNGGKAEMLELIEKVRDYRVLLVGDAILDTYEYVIPMGKPAKESILAARYHDRELFAGGVFAAANHVAAICGEVDVVTCLGEATSYEDFIRESLHPKVRLHVIRRPGASTTVKRRYVDPSNTRKLFEVYVMDDEPLESNQQDTFNREVARLASSADVTIVADFGHGLIAPTSIDTLIRSARFLAVNAQSNSANMGYNLVTKYRRADYICVDAPEARLAISDRIAKIGDIANALGERIDCAKIVITHGRHGCYAYERQGSVHTIPALADKVIDTIGAGDAFFSVTAPLVAAGGELKRVAFIGNIVGALKVEIVGHRKAIEKPALVKAITALLK